MLIEYNKSDAIGNGDERIILVDGQMGSSYTHFNSNSQSIVSSFKDYVLVAVNASSKLTQFS
jgi:hypothetical protein